MKYYHKMKQYKCYHINLKIQVNKTQSIEGYKLIYNTLVLPYVKVNESDIIYIRGERNIQIYTNKKTHICKTKPVK